MTLITGSANSRNEDRRQRGRVVSASDSQSGSPRVRVPLWPLAGFVLARPKFKFPATLVNSQLVAFCQLGFVNPVMLYLNYLFLNI